MNIALREGNGDAGLVEVFFDVFDDLMSDKAFIGWGVDPTHDFGVDGRVTEFPIADAGFRFGKHAFGFGNGFEEDVFGGG